MVGNTVDSEKPDLQEQYATSATASNLRVEADKRSAADMVIAAGMSSQRLGMALMRLMSEWDASAKPERMRPEQVKALAASFSRVEHGPHAGLVEVDGSSGKTEYLLPLVLAAKMADEWHAQEVGMLFRRLKTLPGVRNGLVWWAENTVGIEDALHVVSSVLQWWLSKTCPACHGVKLRIVAGTGRTGARPCSRCNGSGEAKLPHGWQGAKVLACIHSSRAAAVRDLRSRLRPPKKD